MKSFLSLQVYSATDPNSSTNSFGERGGGGNTNRGKAQLPYWFTNSIISWSRIAFALLDWGLDVYPPIDPCSIHVPGDVAARAVVGETPEQDNGMINIIAVWRI